MSISSIGKYTGEHPQARLYLRNWPDYEADYKERYGKSADVPQRIKYRTLKR